MKEGSELLVGHSQLRRVANFAEDNEVQSVVEELEAIWRRAYGKFRTVSFSRISSSLPSPNYSERARDLVHGLVDKASPLVPPVSNWEYFLDKGNYSQDWHWHYDCRPVSIVRFKGAPTNFFVGISPKVGYEPRRREFVSSSSGDLVYTALTDYHQRSAGTLKQNREWRQSLLLFHS